MTTLTELIGDFLSLHLNLAPARSSTGRLKGRTPHRTEVIIWHVISRGSKTGDCDHIYVSVLAGRILSTWRGAPGCPRDRRPDPARPGQWPRGVPAPDDRDAGPGRMDSELDSACRPVGPAAGRGG